MQDEAGGDITKKLVRTGANQIRGGFEGRREAGAPLWRRLKETLAVGTLMLSTGCGQAAMPVQPTAMTAQEIAGQNAPGIAGKEGTVDKYAQLTVEAWALANDPAVIVNLQLASRGNFEVLDLALLDYPYMRTLVTLIQNGQYEEAFEIYEKWGGTGATYSQNGHRIFEMLARLARSTGGKLFSSP
jgi:hypothetical protein